MRHRSSETEFTVSIFIAREESHGATQKRLAFLLFPKWKTASLFYYDGAVLWHLEFANVINVGLPKHYASIA